VLYVPGLIAGRSCDQLAVPATFRHGIVVVQHKIFALFRLEVVVDVGDRRGNLENDKNIGAQVEDPGRYIIIDAGDEGHHRNHRGDPDDYTQQRQHGAQLVGPQGPHRDANGFGEMHGSGPRSADLRLRNCRADISLTANEWSPKRVLRDSSTSGSNVGGPEVRGLKSEV